MNKTTTNKKTNRRKVIALAMCLVMAVTAVVGGAFAKYTTTVKGSDQASVAVWKIEVNDVNMTPAGDTATLTFDLFNTIKDSNGNDAEANVKTDLIAPGTSGSFDVKIENLSEVDATYELVFAVTNDNNIPVEFSVDGGSNWDSDISTLGATLGMESGEATETVYWRWVIDGDDAADTALGIAAQTQAPTISVACTATFTQVD